MTERERTSSPESEGLPAQEYLGLQARLAMGSIEALNPENISINLTVDRGAKFNAEAIFVASIREREKYWEGKTDQYTQWSEQMINIFNKKKDFFENEGKSWIDLYKGIGIISSDDGTITQEDVDKIYAKYCNPDKKSEGIGEFGADLIDYFTDKGLDSRNSSEAIKWITNIFGDKSSDVITSVALVFSSGKTPEDYRKILEEKNSSGIQRINDLENNPREKELLQFLWEANKGGVEEDTSDPAVGEPDNKDEQSSNESVNDFDIRYPRVLIPDPDQLKNIEQRFRPSYFTKKEDDRVVSLYNDINSHISIVDSPEEKAEDSFGYFRKDDGTVDIVLADGVSGAVFSKLASREAVRASLDHLRTHTVSLDTIIQADQAVQNPSQERMAREVVQKWIDNTDPYISQHGKDVMRQINSRKKTISSTMLLAAQYRPDGTLSFALQGDMVVAHFKVDGSSDIITGDMYDQLGYQHPLKTDKARLGSISINEGEVVILQSDGMEKVKGFYSLVGEFIKNNKTQDNLEVVLQDYINYLLKNNEPEDDVTTVVIAGRSNDEKKPQPLGDEIPAGTFDAEPEADLASDVVDTMVNFSTEQEKELYLQTVESIKTGFKGDSGLTAITMHIGALEKTLPDADKKKMYQEVEHYLSNSPMLTEPGFTSEGVIDKIRDYMNKLLTSTADIDLKTVPSTPPAELGPSRLRRLNTEKKTPEIDDQQGSRGMFGGHRPSLSTPFILEATKPPIVEPIEKKPIVLGGKGSMLEETTQILRNEKAGEIQIQLTPEQLINYAKSIQGLPNKGKIEELTARFIGENLQLLGKVSGKKGPVKGVIGFSLEFKESPVGIRLINSDITYNAAANFAKDQIEPKIKALNQEIISGLTKALASTGARAEAVHLKDKNIVVNFRK